MIKRIISLSLVIIILISGCAQISDGNYSQVIDSDDNLLFDSDGTDNGLIDDNDNEEIPVSEITDLKMLPIAEGEDADPTEYEYEVEFDRLDSDGLQRYVTDTMYEEIVSELEGTDYYVSDICSAYVSQEYIDQLAYNSKSNIFFGYTLEELDAQFEGKRYIFTLGEQSDTIVTAYDEYDYSYDGVIRNIADGTGVLLYAVTLSENSSSKTISIIFAFSALTGTVAAVSSAGVAGLVSGLVVGIQTGDLEEAKNAAVTIGSEGFKWGALVGTAGGTVVGTYQVVTQPACLLTDEQVSIIQKGVKYPLRVIRQLCGIEEYDALQAANLIPCMVNGETALIKVDINLDILDELGRTNLQRMLLGLAPYDENGNEYLLRMLGEGLDSTLAILSNEDSNNSALSNFVDLSDINSINTSELKKKFWKTMAEILLDYALSDND